MAHKRFRSRGISDSQRRKKTWVSLKNDTTVSTAGVASFQTAFVMGTLPQVATGGIGNDFLASVLDPSTTIGDAQSTLPSEFTILRICGSLLFPKSTAAASAGVPTLIGQQNAIGFGVTDIRSIINGSVPGPIVDADWDGWMFMRQSNVSPVDSIGSVVDVKSMRKLRDGDAFFISAQSVVGDTAQATDVEWFLDLRLLLLLP